MVSVRARRLGFTLVELLLVMMIIVVLAALVVPRLTGKAKDAQVAAATAQIANLEACLKNFEIDNGRFPTSEEGLGALVTAPSGLENWKGPYLDKGVPLDPWRHPYIYRCPGTHRAADFDISSAGPDGREGTDDDVVNWSADQ